MSSQEIIQYILWGLILLGFLWVLICVLAFLIHSITSFFKDYMGGSDTKHHHSKYSRNGRHDGPYHDILDNDYDLYDDYDLPDDYD